MTFPNIYTTVSKKLSLPCWIVLNIMRTIVSFPVMLADKCTCVYYRKATSICLIFTVLSSGESRGFGRQLFKDR